MVRIAKRFNFTESFWQFSILNNKEKPIEKNVIDGKVVILLVC